MFRSWPNFGPKISTTDVGIFSTHEPLFPTKRKVSMLNILIQSYLKQYGPKVYQSQIQNVEINDHYNECDY